MSLETSITGLPGLQERLKWLANPPIDKLLKQLGQKGAAQTRDRIREQQRSPEGDKWAAWSPAYAKGKQHGPALLNRKGNLLKDIGSDVVAEGAEVGTSLPYGRFLQDGDQSRHLPPRPWLGVSARNETALTRVVEKFFVLMGATA